MWSIFRKKSKSVNLESKNPTNIPFVCVKESSQSSEPCPICNTETNYQVFQQKEAGIESSSRMHHMYTCPNCHHVVNKGNISNRTSTNGIRKGRSGTFLHKGLEFALAQSALPLLDSQINSALVFGAGYSLDHHHINKLPSVSECLATDMKNYQNVCNLLTYLQIKNLILSLLLNQ